MSRHSPDKHALLLLALLTALSGCLNIAQPPTDSCPLDSESCEPQPGEESGTPQTWSSTGNLSASRFDHTATLLPSGKVLVTGGTTFHHGSTIHATAEVYDPGTGTWSPTGSLSSSRSYHTATLLPSGKVLVTGGFASGSPSTSYGSSYLATAEVYDPGTGTWSPTGSLSSSRALHTATLLPSGKVLVTGGRNGGGDVVMAEVYEPETGTWSPTGSLSTGRVYYTATLLPSGKVLVTGGITSGGSGLVTAEVYDPGTGLWSPTGSLATGRLRHAATLLPSGKVLVTGGGSFSAELYDPGTGTWTSTGKLATRRSRHTATLLPSGKVLVTAGYELYADQGISSVEVYDPETGTWSTTDELAWGRVNHMATLLPSGKVLVTGGSWNPVTEVYTP